MPKEDFLSRLKLVLERTDQKRAEIKTAKEVESIKGLAYKAALADWPKIVAEIEKEAAKFISGNSHLTSAVVHYVIPEELAHDVSKWSSYQGSYEQTLQGLLPVGFKIEALSFISPNFALSIEW